ncbi:MAG: phosphomannomutase CpsG [Sideroxyarcus sp.]|nr:phosphomannomutase CpsG [Sideroxyarcus sp.]
MTLTCFKAYDIRGKLGEELNDDIAYRIGRAYAQHLGAKRVVVGGDVRLTSATLKQSLAHGLMDGGADVIDIGMVGTEEIYFAAFHLDVDGGTEVTASHNPMDYNGMKLVARGAVPISGDTGLKAIQALAEANQFVPVGRTSVRQDSVGLKPDLQNIAAPVGRASASVGRTSVRQESVGINPDLQNDDASDLQKRGTLTQSTILTPYVDHLLTYIEPSAIKPLKLVVNSGNGAAGHVIDEIEARFKQLNIPITFIKVHHEADGTFPNGIPNPLLPENRAATTDTVKAHKADMGIAWDGDFDRCFLFDEHGEFIEGYYIVGLLAAAFLAKHPGEKIIHDPRLTWNTIDVVKQSGGIPIQSKTGHAFIKERMRAENAVYGGEMSAHHYFRDFAYCDSGMIPWLLVTELLSRSGKRLSQLVGERIAAYPCSGEINYRVSDVKQTIERILSHYLPQNPVVDRTDGVSVEFADWRFNLRGSNTEPLLRLNVESRGDAKLMEKRTAEIAALIGG